LSKQSRTSENQHKEKKRRVIKPPAPASQANAADLNPALHAESVDKQVAVLQRMPDAQRQAAIQRIAQARGNRHMQRVTAAFAKGKGKGRRSSASAIQAKLAVGETGDRYEQEADRVADTVLQKSQATSSPPPDGGNGAHTTGSVVAPVEQIQASGENVPTVSPEVEARVDGLRGQGSPLSHPERVFFEDRFGADFSGVRIHTNDVAVQTAQDLNARAYTLGNDVVFNSGQYEPGSERGRRLMAHELTHVVQQGKVAMTPSSRQQVSYGGRQTLQRQPDDDNEYDTLDWTMNDQDDVEWNDNLYRLFVRYQTELAEKDCDWAKFQELNSHIDQGNLQRGQTYEVRFPLGVLDSQGVNEYDTLDWTVNTKDNVEWNDNLYRLFVRYRTELAEKDCDWVKFQELNSHIDQGNLQPGQTYEVHFPLGVLDSQSLTEQERDQDHGESKPEFVKFTFDDGPRSGYTESILSTLAGNNIKAGFFVNGPGESGNWTDFDQVPNIKDAGHIVGNHTWNHSSDPDMFEKLHNEVLDTCGYEMKYWRGPGGNPSGLTEIAAELGYVEHIHWEFDSLDYTGKTADEIVEDQIINAKARGSGPRGVVLMHDISAAAILPAIIEKLRNKDINIENFP
jgi:peptidoglycan/xylan/chitin deacetylase (PgdA/CDA1 family)